MIHLHNAYCSFIFPLSLPWSGYYESLPQCYLVDKAALIAVRFSKVGLVTTRRVSRRWRLMFSVTTTWRTDKLTRLVVSTTTQLSLPSIPVSKGLLFLFSRILWKSKSLSVRMVKNWDFGIILQLVEIVSLLMCVCVWVMFSYCFWLVASQYEVCKISWMCSKRVSNGRVVDDTSVCAGGQADMSSSRRVSSS